MILNIFCGSPRLAQWESAMVDFAGAVCTLALIVFLTGALLVSMDLSRGAKLWLAAIVGLWTGVAAGVAAAGWMPIARPVPVVGVFVAVPLIAAALFMRGPLMSLPLSLMVGLNIPRVVGFLFLVLQAQGRLSGPFPHSAGWGDIITGAVAVPMWWLAREPKRNGLLLHAWNLFGLADLVAAIGLGVMSAASSPLEVFPTPGSAAMNTFPWSFVPTVLVPIWIMLHAVIFVQLRRFSRGRNGTDQGV
jgi:hypothetical protein